MGTFTISHVSLEWLKKILCGKKTSNCLKKSTTVTKRIEKKAIGVWIIMAHSTKMQAKELETKEIRP